MDVRDLVRSHYGGADLAARIRSALAAAGVDPDRLEPSDLHPVDQLHAGGVAASRHLLERVGVRPGTRLLDLGCGIGGTARLAASYGATVTGLDLTPELVAAAASLTRDVGLDGSARFLTGSAEALPFRDGAFDAVVLVHVGMNLPDKASVFAEVRRVLAADGVLGVYDQVRTGPGPLPHPLPWADDERTSFVESLEDYAAALASARLEVVATEDRTARMADSGPAGPVSRSLVLGEGFARRIGNDLAAVRSGLLGAAVLVARPASRDLAS